MSTSYLVVSVAQIVHLVRAGYFRSKRLCTTPKLIGQLILSSRKAIEEFGDGVREALKSAVGVAVSTVDLGDLKTMVGLKNHQCRLLPIKMDADRVPVLVYYGYHNSSWWFRADSPFLVLEENRIRSKDWPEPDQCQRWKIANVLEVKEFTKQHSDLVRFLGGMVGYCRGDEGFFEPKGFFWRDWGGTTVYGSFEQVAEHYAMTAGPVLGWLLIMRS